MSRAFQILEVPQEEVDEERYLYHRKEMNKTLKNVRKKDRRRGARIHFHSIY